MEIFRTGKNTRLFKTLTIAVPLLYYFSESQ